MKILVFLENSVPSFAVTDQHVTWLASAYPGATVSRVTSEKAFLAQLGKAEVVACWRFKSDWYVKAPRLQIVSTPAAGKEFLDEDPTGRVERWYGKFHGTIMSETLLGMVLHFGRGFHELQVRQNKHEWSVAPLAPTRVLGAQRICFVGYGAIARYCARVFKSFGCAIDAVRRTTERSEADKDADRIVAFTDAKDVLAEANHVVTVLPGDSSTDGIITREHFSVMNPSAYFYNLGRGNCYAEQDLVWALETGKIAGAGLDVFGTEPLQPDSRLWDMPNVLVLPHASAICRDYLQLYFEEFASRLRNA